MKAYLTRFGLPIAVCGWFLCAAAPSRGDPRLLNDAQMSDQLMVGILERMTLVQRQMEDGAVFLKDELDGRKRERTLLARARSQSMRPVLAALEQSVIEQDQAVSHYRTAYEHRTQLVTLLERLAEGKQKEAASGATVDGLRDLRELISDVAGLAGRERNKAKLSKQDLDRYPVYAERARAIAAALGEEDTAGKKVAAAAGNLAEMDAVAALKKLLEAEKILEEQMDARRPEMTEQQKQRDALDGLVKRLDGHIADAKAQAQKANADKAMTDAVKMEGTRQELKDAEMDAAAKNVEKAQGDLLEQRPAQAVEALSEARNEVAQKRDEIDKAMREAMDELEKLLTDINNIEKIARDLAETRSEHSAKTEGAHEPSEAEKQAMADKMNDLAKQMREQPMEAAGRKMEQAAENTLADNHPEAQKDMQDAQAALQQELSAKLQQLLGEGQGPEEPESREDSQKKGPDVETQGGEGEVDENSTKDIYSGGEVEVELGAVRMGPTWRERLPERERQALLTSRQERYAPGMEDHVRRYFETLAKTR
jgi:hypothetical protein